MSKLGTQFELVLSDVLRELNPTLDVKQGEWVEGPDGGREIDVLVDGVIDGVRRRIQIECKDYNPAGRPIGIAQIDALDSKHQDLGMDVSFLCSNAGFTEEATRKAKRLGIGLIAVLRKGDSRVRYRVIDEAYTRRVDFVPGSATINLDTLLWFSVPAGTKDDEITYGGIPVINWLTSRVAIFVAANPIVKGRHTLGFRFKGPLQFDVPNGKALARGFRVSFEITGGWFAHKVEIDATSGLYDWLRQTIRLGPGPSQVIYEGIKVGEGGKPIDCPPELERVMSRALSTGEFSLWVVDLGHIEMPSQIPQLDEFVMPEDLAPLRLGIPREAYCSG